MKKLLPVLIALCGCAHLYVGTGAERREIPAPENPGIQTAEEPAYCLVSISFASARMPGLASAVYAWMKDATPFRDFRPLTNVNLDPAGCDLFVDYLGGGALKTSADVVKAYSAYGGNLLWNGSFSGMDDVFEARYLARAMHAAFQPGQPEFEALQKEKSSGRVPTQADVARLFGQKLRPLSDYIPGAVETAPARRPAPPPLGPAPAASAAASPVSTADGVDIAEPKVAATRPDFYSIIIGVGRYRRQLPPAEFADADATMVSRYVLGYGVPAQNIVTLLNDEATKSDFEKNFEKWLPNHVDAKSHVFVYFSGHGAPNPRTGDAYLVPYDGDPLYLEETAYPLKKLYAQLAKLPTKDVLVVMDSCFSGAGGRSVIAAGDQTSNAYREKGHGLFTYFFLKGLQQYKSDTRAVFDYLKPQVSAYARRELNTEQEPQWRQGK